MLLSSVPKKLYSHALVHAESIVAVSPFGTWPANSLAE